LPNQDEYITLLHLRRVVQKQRWLRKHAPSRTQGAQFDWTMLSIECYQMATTKAADNPAAHKHPHHFNPDTVRLLGTALACVFFTPRLSPPPPPLQVVSSLRASFLPLDSF
jgi:hypothetical protein